MSNRSGRHRAAFPTVVRDWVARVLGVDRGRVEAVHLRGDRVWLIRAPRGEVVVKCGPAGDWSESFAVEAAGLRVAAGTHLVVPECLGVDGDLEGSGIAALVMTRLPGSTDIPRVPDPAHLRTLGEAAAAIHSVELEPTTELPQRLRHTSWTDLALWRRWGRRYRVASRDDRASVLQAFLAANPLGGQAPGTGATAWTIEDALEALTKTGSTELLDEAGDRLEAAVPPHGPMFFVHGDLWHGNTMWDGTSFVGVIDWEVAGTGHPGVDLGCLRWDAAMQFGLGAADDVLAGWEAASGRRADGVAYWDLVAVLNYPADLGALTRTLTAHGRADLDPTTLHARRDAFTQAALRALD